MTADELAAVVSDEAERCGVDVRELARVLLGWTVSDLRQAEVAVAWHRDDPFAQIAKVSWGQTVRNTRSQIGVTRGIVHDAASPPAAPGGDESSGR